jgi:hypothetical protein
VEPPQDHHTDADDADDHQHEPELMGKERNIRNAIRAEKREDQC